MATDRGNVLTHLYGLGGLIPGLVSIYYLVQSDASWREYALVASGWAAALLYALMLLRAFHLARKDGEDLAALRAQVTALQKELQGRNTLLEFFAGLHMGKTAIPKSPLASPVDGEAAHDQPAV